MVKSKKVYTAEDLFNAIPGEVKSKKINIINKINENISKGPSVSDVKYRSKRTEETYICSEIMDQGLMFIVNDGDVEHARCMIVLPEYSNLEGCGENKYLDPDKKYTYILMNELNVKTMERKVTARVMPTEDFELETGIDVSKYFRTKDNIELFADELAEHINLIKQCNSKDTARTVCLEIMKRALHP